MLDPAFGHWLAGFIDGEGCFLINKTGQPLFKLCVRDDERPMLEEITQRTGIGSIWARPAVGVSRPQAWWTVSTRADCAALVELLDTYPLRAKKRHDFAVWSLAVRSWLERRPATDRLGYRETLRSGRAYGAVPSVLAAPDQLPLVT